MEVTLAWAALIIAGLLDVAWAIAMKQSQGYTHVRWSLVSFIMLAGFVLLLGRALRILPLGTAYAVWTGIGAAGTVLAGAALFGEALTLPRLGGIVLVMTGIVVLKLAPG